MYLLFWVETVCCVLAGTWSSTVLSVVKTHVFCAHCPVHRAVGSVVTFGLYAVTELIAILHSLWTFYTTVLSVVCHCDYYITIGITITYYYRLHKWIFYTVSDVQIKNVLLESESVVSKASDSESLEKCYDFPSFPFFHFLNFPTALLLFSLSASFLFLLIVEYLGYLNQLVGLGNAVNFY